MSAEPPIAFDFRRIEQIKSRIPAADFVGSQYDHEAGVHAKHVLILLSTPRSGSTLLCELLRLNAVCLAHEYFHAGQYMPVLAERWQCIRGSILDEAAYVVSLRRYRTYPNGWLGINVHGRHLRYFTRMERYLSDAVPHFVHLVRREVIAQAVSYYIASQTRQWSSEFMGAATPDYDYNGILKQLRRIQEQNVFIHAFLAARQIDAVTIYYEDLVACTQQTLRTVPGVPLDRQLVTQASIRRQSGGHSAQWAQRFAQEFMATATLDEPGRGERGLQRVTRLLRRRVQRRLAGK